MIVLAAAHPSAAILLLAFMAELILGGIKIYLDRRNVKRE